MVVMEGRWAAAVARWAAAGRGVAWAEATAAVAVGRVPAWEAVAVARVARQAIAALEEDCRLVLPLRQSAPWSWTCTRWGCP